MILDAVCFYTNNLEKAVDFYQNTLQLKLQFKKEDKIAFFQFENQTRLAIKKAVETREVPGKQTLFAQTDNAAKDYHKLKEKGVPFHKHLVKEPWGEEFAILDPDGNKIEFTQRND